MNAVVHQILANVTLGEARSAGSLSVVPIFGDLPLGPRYITLGEAIEAEVLDVTEVDEGGVVGALRARNTGTRAVLILDGEELLGAKQNRVLNTTVLIGAGSTVDLPVSCTERGRWHYESYLFSDSGHVAEHRVRAAARMSVTENVRTFGSMQSDQSSVWSEVDRLGVEHALRSPTAAMRDVVEHRRADVDRLIGSLHAEAGQRGLLAVVDGAVLGFDLVSRPEAYARLHDRILRCYALGALRSQSKADCVKNARTAREWMVALAEVEGTAHESPGMGKAHRFSGPHIAGAALTFRSAIVHAAFLAVNDSPGGGPGRGPSPLLID